MVSNSLDYEFPRFTTLHDAKSSCVLSPKNMEELNFGWALAQLKQGKKVARDNWNGKGQYLELQRPDEHSKMGLPYIYICTVQNKLVPWVASQTDILAAAHPRRWSHRV